MEKKYTICIGRQYGSGGREIGELVARKLGVTCYDKLLIQEAAKKSGMDTQFLATHEETMKDMLLPISGNPFADTADMSGLFYFAGDHAYNAEILGDDRQMRFFHSGANRECAVRIPVWQRG